MSRVSLWGGAVGPPQGGGCPCPQHPPVPAPGGGGTRRTLRGGGAPETGGGEGCSEVRVTALGEVAALLSAAAELAGAP